MMIIFRTGSYELDIRPNVSVLWSCESDGVYLFWARILTRLLIRSRHWKIIQWKFTVELLAGT